MPDHLATAFRERLTFDVDLGQNGIKEAALALIAEPETLIRLLPELTSAPLWELRIKTRLRALAEVPLDGSEPKEEIIDPELKQEIVALLHKIFSKTELLRLVYYIPGKSQLRDKIGEGSVFDVINSCVDVLAEDGVLMERSFWDQIIQERRMRINDIRPVMNRVLEAAGN